MRSCRITRRASSRLILLGGLLVLAACSSGTPVQGGLDPYKPGSLSVAVTGLPESASDPITVSGPGGFSRAVGSTTTITGLTPGTYYINAAPVTTGVHGYAPSLSSQNVSVAPGPSVASASVSYAIATGQLAVTVTGLPAGAAAAVTVSGPGGYHRLLTRDTTLAGLTPGSYLIAADQVTAGTDSYDPAQGSQSAAIVAGTDPVTASVSYALASGSLSVVVTGIPQGTSGQVTVTGPGGYQSAVTASTLLTTLAPGSYQLSASTLMSGGHTWQPSAATQQVTVVAQPVPAVASVSYALATGALAVTVSGLPGGAIAAVTVTGPGGYTHQVSASTTLVGLVPGSYTVSASGVTYLATPYIASPTSQSVSVSASLTPSAAAVTYSQGTGSLALSVTGLPGGASAAVQVTGPGSFSQAVTASTTLSGLTPGSYTVAAATVTLGGHGYAGAPASQNVTVTSGATANASVVHAISTGGLTVTVSGLPGGTNAAIVVTGPGGFSQAVTGTNTLTGLVPGAYTITSAAVASGGQTYAPSPVSQNATVSAGLTPASASVVYAVTTGSLTVTIGGLPGGVSAAVTVTGPGGFNQSITGTQTFTGLTPGSYTVATSTVVNGATTYTAAPASQNASVSAGGSAAATVTYTAGPPPALNLRVDGAYLVQATQRYDGSVRLVAGRDAYVRVFAQANQANSASPQVRVRIYWGAALQQTYTIGAPTASVPTSVNQGSLTASWNVLVPGALVQPTLKVLVDVDPANAIAEADETDNAFPVSGVPASVTVVTLPTFNVRFVPVLQSVNGLQGNVTAGNQATFLADVRGMLPIAAYDADIRAPYTTSAAALVSDNSNNAWGTILSEVLALKSADGSARYYYGVVKTTYSSGVAGMGYVGGGARTAIGWDRLPSGSGVMAHELGHNMGRQHAPCGGPASPDPSYPYPNAQIGVWGMDVAAGTLKSATGLSDLMSYCDPDWISDYTWEGIVTYRLGGPNNSPVAEGSIVAGASRGLLVWGRIMPAGLMLEPAFVVDAPAQLPGSAGPHRLDLMGAAGRVLSSLSFSGVPVPDLPGGAEEHFAFVVPLTAALEQGLQGVRLSANGASVLRVSSSATSGPATEPVRLRPVAPGVVEVSWDAARYPMVLVRDPVTGQILSFARGGRALVATTRRSLDVSTSDGVTTRRAPTTLEP